MEQRFLTDTRGVTSDWHFDQADALLKFAVEHHSATALVYACFEARNAIERSIMEMALLATGGPGPARQTQPRGGSGVRVRSTPPAVPPVVRAGGAPSSRTGSVSQTMSFATAPERRLARRYFGALRVLASEGFATPLPYRTAHS